MKTSHRAKLGIGCHFWRKIASLSDVLIGKQSYFPDYIFFNVSQMCCVFSPLKVSDANTLVDS